MPPDRPSRGTPADWLRHARADLALARVALPPDSMHDLLCFHTQQAVEKAIKGVLLAHGIGFPRTHNIRTLLDLCSPTLSMPPDIEEAASLTGYAVISRYPLEAEPVTEEEYSEGIEIASDVIA